MILDILTYDCQHRKTVDILNELLVLFDSKNFLPGQAQITLSNSEASISLSVNPASVNLLHLFSWVFLLYILMLSFGTCSLSEY